MANWFHAVGAWIESHPNSTALTVGVLLSLYATEIRQFLWRMFTVPPQKLWPVILQVYLHRMETRLRNLTKCHGDAYNTFIYMARDLVPACALILTFSISTSLEVLGMMRGKHDVPRAIVIINAGFAFLAGVVGTRVALLFPFVMDLYRYDQVAPAFVEAITRVTKKLGTMQLERLKKHRV